MGIIGFIDDYIKVFRKDKKGLHGRFKILGQVGLGLIIALTMIYHKTDRSLDGCQDSSGNASEWRTAFF